MQFCFGFGKDVPAIKSGGDTGDRFEDLLEMGSTGEAGHFPDRLELQDIICRIFHDAPGFEDAVSVHILAVIQVFAFFQHVRNLPDRHIKHLCQIFYPKLRVFIQGLHLEQMLEFDIDGIGLRILRGGDRCFSGLSPMGFEWEFGRRRVGWLLWMSDALSAVMRRMGVR